MYLENPFALIKIGKCCKKYFTLTYDCTVTVWILPKHDRTSVATALATEEAGIRRNTALKIIPFLHLGSKI